MREQIQSGKNPIPIFKIGVSWGEKKYAKIADTFFETTSEANRQDKPGRGIAKR